MVRKLITLLAAALLVAGCCGCSPDLLLSAVAAQSDSSHDCCPREEPAEDCGKTQQAPCMHCATNHAVLSPSLDAAYVALPDSAATATDQPAVPDGIIDGIVASAFARSIPPGPDLLARICVWLI